MGNESGRWRRYMLDSDGSSGAVGRLDDLRGDRSAPIMDYEWDRMAWGATRNA
jgi:hypothetical protein